MSEGVVFINNSMETFTPTNSGALATIICECCRVAQQQSYQPLVITRSSSVPSYDWADTMFLDYPPVPANPLAVKLFRAERRLTGWQHLRQRTYAVRVAQAIRKAGVADKPLVLLNDPQMAVFLRHRFPHAVILHWFQNQLECKPKFRHQFAQSVDAAMACSDFTARWIENYYGMAKDSVHTVYNAVDSRRFQPRAARDGEEVIINFVGRTGVEKAVDLLLDAALRLSTKTHAFQVQILGSNHWGPLEWDNYQRRLQDMVAELEGRGIRVNRPGHISREALPREIQKAHIHVVPSRWDEPFGMTTVEGMACGLAVVASKTGGTPEVVGDAGFLFERDSVEDLTAHLEALVMDPKLRGEYGRRGRLRAEEFSWDRTWSQVKGLAKA